jgi:hypothetical protein
MVLGIRLCMDEFEDGGYTVEDAVAVAAYLAQKKLMDYVSTTSGTTQVKIMQIPPMAVPLGYAEYMAAALKKAVDVPVIAYGRINDPVQAEQILQNGSADLIGMARQLICDPETPNKAIAGDIDGIRKCVACVDGCSGQAIQLQPIRCIQHPAVGKEALYGADTLVKADKRKSIVIVGGGVAGMKAAEIAAKRGHDILLLEKEAVLGGQINLVQKIPFRNEFSEITRYLAFQLRHLPNVTVKLNVEATEKTILEESPDVVIIATGATRYVPDPYRSGKSCTGWDLLRGYVKIGTDVVIYDKLAKEEGLGVAEYLTEYYTDANILFFTPANCPGKDIHILNQDALYRKVLSGNVTVFPFHEILTVNKEAVTFTHRFSKKAHVVDAYDNYVHIGDMVSDDFLYKSLHGKVEELYRLGDARAPRIVELAIHGAEELARAI